EFVRNRRMLMRRVFYRYVSLPDARIDRQIVRSALDNFGWFWVFVEASFLFLVTAGLAVMTQSPATAREALLSSLVFVLLSVIKWQSCRRTTSEEVKAILELPVATAEIRGEFDRLFGRQEAADPGPGTSAIRGGPEAIVDVFISHASEDKPSVARPL